jgi:hypothetical protein
MYRQRVACSGNSKTGGKLPLCGGRVGQGGGGPVAEHDIQHLQARVSGSSGGGGGGGGNLCAVRRSRERFGVRDLHKKLRRTRRQQRLLRETRTQRRARNLPPQPLPRDKHAPKVSTKERKGSSVERYGGRLGGWGGGGGENAGAVGEDASVDGSMTTEEQGVRGGAGGDDGMTRVCGI